MDLADEKMFKHRNNGAGKALSSDLTVQRERLYTMNGRLALSMLRAVKPAQSQYEDNVLHVHVHVWPL